MLILASASPWRATLLKQAGFEFKIIPTDLDESPYQQSIHDPELLVKTLAEKKAESCFSSLITNHQALGTILAADTIVWANNQIIGKPTDRQDARRIIQLLSGTTHQVWTGVVIIRTKESPFSRETGNKPRELLKTVFSEKSDVTFKKMTDQEIESYLDTNDWVGKAGGYQLQRHINQYVEKIEGDPGTVIGLPMNRLKTILLKQW